MLIIPIANASAIRRRRVRNKDNRDGDGHHHGRILFLVVNETYEDDIDFTL